MNPKATGRSNQEDSPVVLSHDRDSTWITSSFQFTLTFMMMHYLLWGPLILFGFYRLDSFWGYTSLVVYFSTYVLDQSHLRGGKPWHWFRKLHIWNFVAEYVGLRLIRTVPLDPTQRYVFGYSPHGILILSRIASYGGGWEKLFPGIQTRVLAATAMFYVPLARELAIWMGAVDARRSSADQVLELGKSVIVYPGGSKEIFATDSSSSKTTILLRPRKGFVKLAIRHGAPLVPTYVFGEKHMFRIWKPPHVIWNFFLRVFKVPLLWFTGQRGTWLPYRTTRGIAVVYGKPIPTTQEDVPSVEQISRIHERYIAELHELYRSYQDEFGNPEEKLDIQ